MDRMTGLIIILLIALSGCRSDAELATLTAIAGQPDYTSVPADATPTPETVDYTPTPIADYMFDRDRYLLLNSNPYMVNTEIRQLWYSIEDGYVEQCVGEGYSLYNLRRNLDGQFGDEHGTHYMPVTCGDNGVAVHFGGIAGQFGYETTVTIDSITRARPEPICLLIQVFGHYRVEDPTYQDAIRGYGMRAWLNDTMLGDYWTPQDAEGDIAPFWAYPIVQNGAYRIRIAWIASWNSSVPGFDEYENERSVFNWYSFLVGIDPGVNGTGVDTHCQ